MFPKHWLYYCARFEAAVNITGVMLKRRKKEHSHGSSSSETIDSFPSVIRYSSVADTIYSVDTTA